MNQNCASYKEVKVVKPVRKPLSAYIFFARDARGRILTTQPGLSFGEIGKLLGQQWKELGEEQKTVYYKMAADDKIRYQNQLKV